MKLLAFDTSTDACSVAVMVDGETLHEHQIAAQRHGALLLRTVDALMAEAGLTPTQLDAVIYGRGPGSFTGVRIGVAAAQGIALGAGIGVVGISTLQAIAQGTYRQNGDKRVAVSVDARMDEVYFCEYSLDSKHFMVPVMPEQIALPSAVSWQASEIWAGSGAERYAPILQQRFAVRPENIRAGCLPEALDLLRLGAITVEQGNLLCAEAASPVYLRDKVALTTQERAAKSSQ